MLSLDEISNKSMLIHASFDISGSSMMTTSSRNDDNVESSPLSLKVDFLAVSMDHGDQPLLPINNLMKFFLQVVIPLKHLTVAIEKPIFCVESLF